MYEFSRKVNCLTSKLLDFVGPKTRRVIKKKRKNNTEICKILELFFSDWCGIHDTMQRYT